MNILLIDGTPALVTAFRAMGHRVDDLRPGGGIFHLPTLLAARVPADRPAAHSHGQLHDAATATSGIVPDLVIQQESLGIRNYFQGLDGMPCPTIFWALDSHLNLFWHQWYGLLFDAVLTPHLSLFAALPAFFRPKILERMASLGQARTWIPHARRTHAMALWARNTANRPLRANLIELLRPLGLYHTEDLSHADMMRLYDDSRVVPNECFTNELNFRFLEAASSGCLVLSPPVGEDQNALLTPGEEYLVYHDGLELLDQIAWAKARPDKAERMALAARRRVNQEHLPEHRAGHVLRIAATLAQHRLSGVAARVALWMTLARQIRSGALPLHAVEHAQKGLRLSEQLPEQTAAKAAPNGKTDSARATVCMNPLYPTVLGECLHLFALGQQEGRTEAEAVARLIVQKKSDAQRTEFPWLGVSVAASAFMLAGGGAHAAFSTCMGWSAALEGAGLSVQPGFAFHPEQGALPDCALDFLLLADSFATGVEQKKLLLSAFERLLRPLPAYLSFYRDVLERYSALEPDNWRLKLEYGHSCLRALQLDEGLMVIDHARMRAERLGETDEFAALRDKRY